jgi:pimeloyl-ACP methyl ester carboxylesterase
VTPKFITARGLRFGYLDAGPADGPLVLLVHGFPDTAYSWDASLRVLGEAGYRAVAIFQRGYFPTEIPADGAYDIDTLGADLLALIPALGAQRAVIVGHDWGAAAAYSAAAMGPERVSALVTVAIPHPNGLRFTPRLMWVARHFFTLNLPNASTRVRANNFAFVDEMWRRWSPAWNDIPASETARVKEAFANAGCAEAAVAYYRTLRKWIPKSLRKKITVPTAAFAGTDDMISPRLYEKSRLMFDGPYEVVQVPGGHFMHREHPETFLPELVRVVRDKAR